MGGRAHGGLAGGAGVVKYAYHRVRPGAYVATIGQLELGITREAGAWHGTVNGRNVTGFGFPTVAQAKRVTEAHAFGHAHREVAA